MWRSGSYIYGEPRNDIASPGTKAADGAHRDIGSFSSSRAELMSLQPARGAEWNSDRCIAWDTTSREMPHARSLPQSGREGAGRGRARLPASAALTSMSRYFRAVLGLGMRSTTFESGFRLND